MKLYVLGTGNGVATKCYNTCFAIQNNGKYFLVDGGGGNQILTQLQRVNIDLVDVHDIFVTHIHTDHILGLIWVVRQILSKIRFDKGYEGNCVMGQQSTTMFSDRKYQDFGFMGKLFGMDVSVHPIFEGKFSKVKGQTEQKLLNPYLPNIYAKSFNARQDNIGFLLNTEVMRDQKIEDLIHIVDVDGKPISTVIPEYTVATKRWAIQHGYRRRIEDDKRDLEFIASHPEFYGVDEAKVDEVYGKLPDKTISNAYYFTHSQYDGVAKEISGDKYRSMLDSTFMPT